MPKSKPEVSEADVERANKFLDAALASRKSMHEWVDDLAAEFAAIRARAEAQGRLDEHDACCVVCSPLSISICPENRIHQCDARTELERNLKELGE